MCDNRETERTRLARGVRQRVNKGASQEGWSGRGCRASTILSQHTTAVIDCYLDGWTAYHPCIDYAPLCRPHCSLYHPQCRPAPQCPSLHDQCRSQPSCQHCRTRRDAGQTGSPAICFFFLVHLSLISLSRRPQVRRKIRVRLINSHLEDVNACLETPVLKRERLHKKEKTKKCGCFIFFLSLFFLIITNICHI